MTEEQTSELPSDLRQSLVPFIRDLRARSRILVSATRLRLGEAKAVAFHIRQQLEILKGSRSRANMLYAFGAVVEREEYLDLDDFAVNGLEHHGALYAYWMAIAASQSLAGSRGELLRYIFSDPVRLDWCRKEGARLAWEYIKAAREEETALFRKRQEKGSKHWRKDPMTARQYYMITLISVRGDIVMPGPLRSGPAHDWIAMNGGHPNFWDAPVAPPRWIIDTRLADHMAPWGRPAA